MGIRFELGELIGVAGRPSQTRRIAELSGLLHDDEVARAWWVKVPEAGDQDAADHLRKLFFEQRKQGPGAGRHREAIQHGCRKGLLDALAIILARG
jgi:hypothetical protein